MLEYCSLVALPLGSIYRFFKNSLKSANNRTPPLLHMETLDKYKTTKILVVANNVAVCSRSFIGKVYTFLRPESIAFIYFGL